MAETNSRGKQPSPKHLEERAREQAYLDEMKQLADKREQRPDSTWTEEDRDEYRRIWEKYHGPLKGGPYGPDKARPAAEAETSEAAPIRPVPPAAGTNAGREGGGGEVDGGATPPTRPDGAQDQGVV